MRVRYLAQRHLAPAHAADLDVIERADDGAFPHRQAQRDGVGIELLPALPKAWSAGSVKGLRARGGFTVDIKWKDGKVTHYRIVSPEQRPVKVRVNGAVKTVMSKKK